MFKKYCYDTSNIMKEYLFCAYFGDLKHIFVDLNR